MIITIDECVKILAGHGLEPLTGVIHLGTSKGEEIEAYVRNGFRQILWLIGDKTRIAEVRDHTCQSPVNQQYVCELFSDTDSLSTKRFDTYYRKNSAMIPLEDYNFLCLNTVGAEIRFLKGLGKLLANYPFKVIYMGVNDERLYDECWLTGEVDEFLKPFGFERFATRMTDLKYGGAIYIRKS
jgi:hypothetical protein